MTTQNLLSTLRLLDYTSLEGNDTELKLKQWSANLLNVLNKVNEKHPAAKASVASVCVYPVFVRSLKRDLSNANIKLAAVAGGFPHGQLPLVLKLNEITYAIDEGADEIDFVISRANVYENNSKALHDEVAAAKEKCGPHLLKVIIESGELHPSELISKTSRTVISAGADFIKTSTGKTPVGATQQAVQLMLNEIRTYHKNTGKKVGIKVSGGVADTTTADQYIQLVTQTLGSEWLTPDLFRIGASRLLTDISSKLGL